MTANELLKLIPEQTFRELAVDTKVDTQVKKLSGELIFKLILFSMIHSNKFSLRVMETYLQSTKFKSFTSYDIIDGKYNSLRDRICTINSNYFEKLFDTIFGIYNTFLSEEKALSKAGSIYKYLHCIGSPILCRALNNAYFSRLKYEGFANYYYRKTDHQLKLF